MNSYQENKASMYLKVRAFLNTHGGELTATPYAADLQAQFDAFLNELMSQDNIAVASSTGYTATKQEKRSNLRNAGLKISRGLSIFCQNSNDKEILNKLFNYKTDFDKLRDTDFYAAMKRHLDMAQEKGADLTPFGVDTNFLSNFATDLEIFWNYIQRPKEMLSERANAGVRVDQLFEELDLLLNQKLDFIMGYYESDNFSLYNLYSMARNIDSTGAVQQPDYSGIAQPGMITEIAIIPYLSSRGFDIENRTTNSSLSFGLCTISSSIEGTPVEVAGGETRTRLSSSLADNGDYVVINNTGSTPIEYRIWINE